MHAAVYICACGGPVQSSSAARCQATPWNHKSRYRGRACDAVLIPRALRPAVRGLPGAARWKSAHLAKCNTPLSSSRWRNYELSTHRRRCRCRLPEEHVGFNTAHGSKTHERLSMLLRGLIRACGVLASLQARELQASGANCEGGLLRRRFSRDHLFWSCNDLVPIPSAGNQPIQTQVAWDHVVGLSAAPD